MACLTEPSGQRPFTSACVVTAVPFTTACGKFGISPGTNGRPTHIFFVLVAPENSTGIHLKALARISRLFKDPEFRNRLMQAKDAADVFRVIADEDAKY